MNDVILIGYFCETVELCKKCGYNIVGIVDQMSVEGYDYLGDDRKFSVNYKEYNNIPLVITPDKPFIRKKLYDHYKSLGFAFSTLIAPDAIISETAIISEGCIIQSGCNVSAECVLNPCVRVNTYANLMHNVIIGDFTTVAPNAVVLGNVKIGSKAYIGANSTILPNINITSNVVVGAGAVVTKDILTKCTVVGIPAKKLR